MSVRPFKPYIAVVTDPEGAVSRYVFMARSRRRARAEAREWTAQTDWGATLVEIKAAVDPAADHVSSRRLLVVAGFTLAVSGTTIAASMFIALSLQDAL